MVQHTVCVGPTPPLNESPSEKEGKSAKKSSISAPFWPSMKVPPKRKGNASSKEPFEWPTNPQ